MKSMFITFEGNDGSGKSSVIEAIREELTKRGYDIVLTREPGGSKIAEKIREVILDVDNTGMDDRTEALLYAASRREHLQKTVIPALKEGKIVLCDRFIDSSLAYQGFARGIGIDEVYNMNLFATEGMLPDLTLLICVRPETGLERIKTNHRGSYDRLENEKLVFHQKVYQAYLEVQKKFPNRIIIIDGEKTKEEVKKASLEVVLKYLGDK